MDYYYQNSNSECVGPLDEATFLEHVNAGAVAADALVWRSGEDAWRTWADAAASWSFGGEEIVPAEPTDSAISADVGLDSLFGDSWKIFKKHWGKFIVAGLLGGVVSFFGSVLSELAFAPGDKVSVGMFAVALVLMLLGSAISCVFSFGFLKVLRKEDAGTSATFGDIFPLGRCFARWLQFLGVGVVWLFAGVGSGLLFTAIIALPILLIGSSAASAPDGATALFGAGALVILLSLAVYIPLVYFFVRFLFTTFFVFETNCGVFEAFAASWKITRGHFWRSLGYGILTTALLYLGSIFTLGIGAIVLLPLMTLWLFVYYIKLCKTSEAPVPASVYAE